jgi:hypothetical protein
VYLAEQVVNFAFLVDDVVRVLNFAGGDQVAVKVGALVADAALTKSAE